jgi:lipoate---protein ligase
MRHDDAMKLLDLTLATAAENVALDQALLDSAEDGQLADDVLRLWEPARPMVVVGRSSRMEDEVDLAACRSAGIPVLRRASGGAAIVTGPGCLMYAVVQRYAGREHLRLLDELHRHVLGIVVKAVGTLTGGAAYVGTSDLAIGGRKFSGNSVRCKRDHFLYHGTLLYEFDLPLFGRLLRMPPRQPEYRGGRMHAEFVMNLPVAGGDLRRAIATTFGAVESLNDWPQDLMQRLAGQRYSQDAWNYER